MTRSKLPLSQRLTFSSIASRLRRIALFRRGRRADQGRARWHNDHIADLPVGDAYHGELAQNYLKNRLQQEYWHLEQQVVSELVKEASEGGTVLDVPFGTGRFVEYYVARQMKVFGLDSSNDMLAIARSELGQLYDSCQIVAGSAESLPYENDQFDLVVCFRFLCHVVSFKQAQIIIGELSRVLRGRAVLQFRVRRANLPAVSMPLAHESMNDRICDGTLRELLAHHGLKTVKTVALESRDTYDRIVFVCEKSRQ